MCGIAGFLGAYDEKLLRRMMSSIRHRGPDDEGLFVSQDEEVGLCHTRLSIIDLAETGHQPMWDPAGTVCVVFNGEIYNYRELRESLLSKGVAFRGTSDTEVLLHLYRELGVEVLQHLNGIFAFAIWDRRRQQLFLARDGLGVKPLYYASTRRGFVFASELKAVARAPDISNEIDMQALRCYLTYLWAPAPLTPLTQVRKLEPGYRLIVKLGGVAEKSRFYDIPYTAEHDDISAAESADRVQSAVETAVKRQLVADVPVGSFLSGGLDSSAVTLFAQRHSPERLQCFTIANDPTMSAADGRSEDLPYARQVAEHLGVDLHVVEATPSTADEVERMVYHLDEPQADLASISVGLIAKLAREHGIKVLLSGAGGDDIFGGYRRHKALMGEGFWSWLPVSGRRAMRDLGCRLPAGLPLLRRVRKAFAYADLPDDERLVSYFLWHSPVGADKLLAEGLRDPETAVDSVTSPILNTLSTLPEGTAKLNQMLYLDAKHFLCDHNLNYTDKMSMSVGVETRVPLLDADLVSMATRLPLSEKQTLRIGKPALRRAMRGLLPDNVIDRKKGGFGVPVRSWLRGPLSSWVDDVLAPDSIRRRGVFDVRAVRALVDADRTGKVDAAMTILSLVCIEIWFRIFLDDAYGGDVQTERDKTG